MSNHAKHTLICVHVIRKILGFFLQSSTFDLSLFAVANNCFTPRRKLCFKVLPETVVAGYQTKFLSSLYNQRL